MKRRGRITFADWLGIGGVVLTILIFVAQEGLPRFDDPRQLAKYKFLLGAIVLVVILYLVGRYIWFLKGRFTDYRDEHNQRIATTLSSTQNAEILNKNGDLRVEYEWHLRVFRNDVPIRRSRTHAFLSETKLSDFRPGARILSASPKISLRPVVLKDGEEEDVAGATNYVYEWFYKFNPPLKNKGASITYSYVITLPGSEAFAFTQHGAHFFFDQKLDYIPNDVTLLAPAGYKIEVVNCFIQDSDGHERELPPGATPQLDATGKKLTGTIPYIKAATLFWHYKLLPE
jgi:hypothetical protein